MTEWEKIQEVFEEADKIKALQELYLERGNITSDQALKLAVEKWKASKNEC